jgi:hypothetical protein
MTESVNFDGELEFAAIEVQHEVADRVWAAELQAIKTTIAQGGP